MRFVILRTALVALEALKAHLCGHVHRGGQQDLGETEPEQEELFACLTGLMSNLDSSFLLV